MDHNNSSNLFDVDSFNFDNEILQQLLSDLPPIIPPQSNDSQAPFSTHLSDNNFMVDHTPKEVVVSPIQNVVTGSASGKGKQPQLDKSKAVEIERLRRQEMSGLYRSLRSILPAEYIRGKRSTADHLEEAVKYIKDMEGNIAKLNEKRDLLVQGKSSGSSSTSSSTTTNNNNSNNNTLNNNNNNNNNNTCNNSTQQCVTVKKCNNEGFYEIMLKTNANDDIDYEQNLRSLPLSKALHLLSREGFSVVNTLSTKIENNLIHTIHAQVDDGRIIEHRPLQQQLINCYL